MNILRVFPRKTAATPIDYFIQIGEPDLFTYQKEISEVHISCTFSFDRKECERLFAIYAKAWDDVKISGPAYGDPGGEFIPGRYIKPGYVITSRGCPNNCWFCDVPQREGRIREIKITEGHNVLDSNLLACSDEHILNVFAMLRRRKEKAEFTGGIEAARLKEWHVYEFKKLKPKQIFFAYDEKKDRDPLFSAGKMFKKHDLFSLKNSHVLRCYVLIGYKSDTFEKAEKRLVESIQAGFMPAAMLYRDKNNNEPDKKWKQFQREWMRPAIISNKIKEIILDK